MNTRTTSLLATLFLSVALAACGGGGGSDATQPPSQSSSLPPAPAPSAPAPAPTPAAPVRVGIADAGFRQALADQGVVVAADGTVDSSAVATVTTIDIEKDYGIVDLTNISAFKGLTKLNVWNNPTLTNVTEVSTLTNLNWLGLYKGQFTSIDLSKLTGLTLLGVTEIVGLNTIDTSTLVNLTEFDVQADCDDPASPWGKTQGLTSLDVSKNVNLQSMDAACQLFTSIDLSHNQQLNTLWLDGNANLTSLDLSHNPMLSSLTVYRDTNLSSLNLKGINGGNLPQRLSAYSTPNLATITVTNPTQYNNWMNTATMTSETQPDGTKDVMYTNGVTTMWIMLDATFSN